MKERDLAKKLRQYICDRDGYAVKTHGDPRQRKGLPDIIAVYRGFSLWLEVKLPGKERTLTKNQAYVLKKAHEAGAIAKMVTSRAQVKEVLDECDAAFEDGT